MGSDVAQGDGGGRNRTRDGQSGGKQVVVAGGVEAADLVVAVAGVWA